MTTIDTVVLDLDGTLVDSVPVHTLAWQAAFRDVGISVATHRIHRTIGMGGDRLVAEVTNEAVERSVGDDVRRLHQQHLDQLFPLIAPTDGAVELLETLHSHGLRLVLASSSDRALTERLLGLVEGADTLLRSLVTGSDAERSKPSGELIEVALAAVDADGAVVVGDAVWDVLAAQRAGVACVGLLTGGVSEAELLGAGAVAVHESPRTLAEHVDQAGTVLPVG